MNSNLAYQEEWREELIGGEVVAMAPATPQHNYIAGNIHYVFKHYIRQKKGKCIPFQDGTAVRLSEENSFIPDFMVVCDRSKISTNRVYGAPDLAVEVLSPSTAKNDKWHKKNVYESSGVPEYWIVSPREKSIEVYLPRKSGRQMAKFWPFGDRKWTQKKPPPSGDGFYQAPQLLSDIACKFFQTVSSHL